ncbi:hypothetical protein [Neorhizobium tomejilense]|uniref:hypothetical protein n=1 Tax=Neorhizobium tomejilense TaxID=2093828 RepID=UPI000CF98639|nr:hypothetical protein [Neorhizobium tomejilense]
MIRFAKQDETVTTMAVSVLATVTPIEARAAEPSQHLKPSPPSAVPPLELTSDLPPSKPSKRRSAAPKRPPADDVIDAGAGPLMLNLDR